MRPAWPINSSPTDPIGTRWASAPTTSERDPWRRAADRDFRVLREPVWIDPVDHATDHGLGRSIFVEDFDVAEPVAHPGGQSAPERFAANDDCAQTMFGRQEPQ